MSPLTDRQTFRETVAQVAARAHEKLPQCHGRIDSAVKLVLAGDVELVPGGGARVASRSDAQVTYHTVNGHCDCKDFGWPTVLCAGRVNWYLRRPLWRLSPSQRP
jgi:hypothetical protein